tara:strand:- start:845 stop:3004 length:2160 start_codon:yes stop_codon:yes gene_type:complete
MPVCHEIKSQLAKLLATEDLVVEHKKVETAEFNVQTRVLTLPVWEKASNGVYDSLVAHEVGHALYTPDVDWRETHNIPHAFVNIVEDARIEKLMKRRYAGLSKTFYYGYQELNDNDFFEINGVDIDEMNLADRINLYFKIGNYVDINFTLIESKFVKKIENCETFNEVLDIAEEIYKYCKDELEETKQQLNASIDTNEDEDDQGGESFDSGINDDQNSEDGEVDIDHQPTVSSDGPVLEDFENIGGETYDEEPEVSTLKSLEESLKRLVGNTAPSSYVELPKVDLDKVIIPNSSIYKIIDQTWEDNINYAKKMYSDSPLFNENIFETVDNMFDKFKKSAQKEVNYLVKEFECKKAADSYARATTSRTGVLDCSKLHSYKYSEDIFKKVTTLADGKNHGLVFILDWSGSMHNVMLDTLKQLYNLLWFCKKVQIPFDVYAFTSEFPYGEMDENGVRLPASEEVDGQIQIPHWFSLMHLFTGDMKGNELEKQMKDIFRIVCSMDQNTFTSYGPPSCMRYSGTPLNETLICLHQILPKFKKENGLQKVQCIILTDGEAQPLKVYKKVQRPWEDEPFLGTVHCNHNSFLRDRKTGYTYSLDVEWYGQTDVLLKNLKHNFPDVNFIGIRLLPNRDSGSFIRRYCGYSGSLLEKTTSSWRKNKSFTIKTSGYDSYFGLSANALSNDDEFQVQTDATKAQIKRAFVKSLKGKKMNKKILGEFIELVA